MKKLSIIAVLAVVTLLAGTTLAIAAETGFVGRGPGHMISSTGQTPDAVTNTNDTPVSPGTPPANAGPGTAHRTAALLEEMRAYMEQHRQGTPPAGVTPGTGPGMDPAYDMPGPYMEPGTGPYMEPGTGGGPYMEPGTGPYMEPGTGPGPYMEPGTSPGPGNMQPGSGMDPGTMTPGSGSGSGPMGRR